MALLLGLAALAHLSMASSEGRLSLQEAVDRARRCHPDVQRAELAAAQVLARRVGAAMVLQRPAELSVDVGHRHDSSGSHPASTGLEWTVRLGQMLDVAGQRGTRLREVRWAVRVAELSCEETRLGAAALAAGDYVRAQAAESGVAIGNARAELAQRVLRMVEAKERAGATGGLERTLAEVERADAQAQLQRALAERASARQALWYGLGLPADATFSLAPLEPPTDAPESITLGLIAAVQRPQAQSADRGPGDDPRATVHAEASAPDAACGGADCLTSLGVAQLDHSDAVRRQLDVRAAQLAELAVVQRPQGQALLAATQGLEASVARVRREVIPSPTFAFEAQKQQPGQQYFGGGITVALPVAQRAQGAQAELAVQIRRSLTERRLFAAQCRRDAQVALVRLAAAYDVWRTVHHEQLPAAQAHVDMTVAAWKAGKLDLSRVVQSLRYLTEARERHLQAVAALWTAHVERHRIVGELP